MALEHALGDQAGDVGHQRLPAVYVIFGVGGGQPDRGWQGDLVGARIRSHLQHQRQIRLRRGVVDGAIDRMAEVTSQAVGSERHGDHALAGPDPADLGRRVFGQGRVDQDLAEQPLVAVEPMIDRPVVGRAHELPGQVGLGERGGQQAVVITEHNARARLRAAQLFEQQAGI